MLRWRVYSSTSMQQLLQFHAAQSLNFVCFSVCMREFIQVCVSMRVHASMCMLTCRYLCLCAHIHTHMSIYNVIYIDSFLPSSVSDHAKDGKQHYLTQITDITKANNLEYRKMPSVSLAQKSRQVEIRLIFSVPCKTVPSRTLYVPSGISSRSKVPQSWFVAGLRGPKASAVTGYFTYSLFGD